MDFPFESYGFSSDRTSRWSYHSIISKITELSQDCISILYNLIFIMIKPYKHSGMFKTNWILIGSVNRDLYTKQCTTVELLSHCFQRLGFWFRHSISHYLDSYISCLNLKFQYQKKSAQLVHSEIRIESKHSNTGQNQHFIDQNMFTALRCLNYIIILLRYSIILLYNPL